MSRGQDLIQKGIKLNDMELVKMGYELIAEENSKNVDKLLVIKTEPQVQEIPKKKRGRPKKVLTNTPQPVIMSEAAATLPPQPEPEVRDPYDFSMQIRTGPLEQGTRVDPITGKTQKYTRKQSVDLSRMKFNTFEDDGVTVKKESKKWLKIQNKTAPVLRVRQPDLVRVKCQGCGREDMVPRILSGRWDAEIGSGVYRCNACIKRRGVV